MKRMISALIVLVTGLALSGCLVSTKTLPAGTPIIDDRLVGAWRGIDDDGKDSDAFLHFLKQAPDKPLRLVWIEDGYQIYDVTTYVMGGHYVFAALPVGSSSNPPDESNDDESDYILGYYEVGPRETSFWLLDPQNVGELIAEGKVAGTSPGGGGDGVTLTASPEALAKFLATEEAFAARADEGAKMKRLSKSPQ